MLRASSLAWVAQPVGHVGPAWNKVKLAFSREVNDALVGQEELWSQKQVTLIHSPFLLSFNSVVPHASQKKKV